MARVAGKNGAFTTQTGEVVAVKSWSLDIDCDALDSTGMDSGGVRYYIAGLKGWKGSAEGIWDTTEAQYRAGGVLIPGTALTTITLNTSDLTPLIQAFSGTEGFVTRFSVSAPVDGEVTWTADFQGCGALTWPGVAV